MKNILKDTPETKLNARLLESLSFVDEKDLKDKKILDIGCGFGWFELHALKKRVGEIVGMEITREDLATAKKFIKDTRASFVIGGALKLPFKDKSFDTVVSWEVIEHIPKNTEQMMFSEVYRVLKPSGKFYLSTPYNSFWSTLTDPAWWLIGHRHYSKKILQKLGKDSGFGVNKLYTKGRFISVLGVLNMYIAKWVFKRRSFFENFFIEQEKKEYKKRNGFYGIFVRYIKK